MNLTRRIVARQLVTGQLKGRAGGGCLKLESVTNLCICRRPELTLVFYLKSLAIAVYPILVR